MKNLKKCFAVMLALQIGSCAAAFTETPTENPLEPESAVTTKDSSAGGAESSIPICGDDIADILPGPADQTVPDGSSAETEPKPEEHPASGEHAVSETETALANEEADPSLKDVPFGESEAAQGANPENPDETAPQTMETENPENGQLIFSGQTEAAEAVLTDKGEECSAEGEEVPDKEGIPVEGEKNLTEEKLAAEPTNMQEAGSADEMSITERSASEEITEEEQETASEEITEKEQETDFGQIQLTGDEILVVTQVMTGGNTEETVEGMIGTTGSDSREELTGATQYGDIVISDVSVSSVTTNPKYSRLVFTFTDENTNQSYRCLMTGLKVSEGNTTEGYNRLAYDVAVSFLSGQTLPLSAERMANRYGLEIELIDAEKQNADTGADTNLCWAASAADMIEFTGWNVYESEDEAFADLSAGFNNLGGTQQMAIKWYVDGINPRQLTDEEGKILYEHTASGAAQQLAEGTGGYWKQYAAPVVSPDNGAYSEIEALLKDGMQKLEQGYALGIGVYTYKNNANQGLGHSLTVFGYIGELLNQTIRRISALFVADSDNDAHGQNTAPSERADTYTMYRVQDYSNGNFDTLELSGYKDAEDTHVVIGTVTSMAPRQLTPLETAGTQNAQENVNLVPVSLEISNSGQQEIAEANAGDTISVSFEITNESYSSLPAGAVAEITIHTTWNGTRLADMTRQVALNGMEPLENRLSSFSYDVLAPGTYVFQMEITSVKDAAGNSISEAYISDNTLQKTKQITVKATQPRIGPETDTPAQNIAPAGQDPLLIGTAEKIYKLQVILGDEATYLREFSAPVKSQTAFMDLRVLKTREIVNPKNYQITLKNGKFQLKFAELFLRMLRPGNNDFELLFNGGRILFRIIIL